MKKCILALLVFCACHTVVSMDASDKLESIRLILLSCGDPDGPTQEEELRALAIAHDISNAEMSSMLIELAGPGLAAHAEPLQRELVDGVLWGLGCFGGAKEKEFVRNVMRTSRDSHLQKAAVRVGIRMMPEGWEEWVREVVSDKRYDEMVRFDAYEEAFRTGRGGDEKTRMHVGEVLLDLIGEDPYEGNRERLRRWSAELLAR